jgi:hypothetical protein
VFTYTYTHTHTHTHCSDEELIGEAFKCFDKEDTGRITAEQMQSVTNIHGDGDGVSVCLPLMFPLAWVLLALPSCLRVICILFCLL